MLYFTEDLIDTASDEEWEKEHRERQLAFEERVSIPNLTKQLSLALEKYIKLNF